ncbi:MAG TPA: leucyl aminopeptidase [Candidatus Obscuribacterales bacterium]
MEVQVVAKPLQEAETEVLVLTVFEDELKQIDYLSALDEQLGGKLSRMIESGEIQGKYREFTLLHVDGVGARRLLIMGLGKRKDFSLDRIRSIAANSARYARRINVREMAIHDFSHVAVPPGDCAEALVEGVILGMYRFDKYKSKKKNAEKLLQKIKIIATSEEAVPALSKSAETGKTLAESANFVRDLVNEPANYMYPISFAECAEEVAKTHGLKIQVLGPEDLEREGMGLHLAVAKGSDQPPRLVVMSYEGNPGGKTIGIVGKGITFDTGGYDLKPSQAMLRMYGDMAGAAATLGAINAIAAEKLAVNVVVAMPLAENMVSSRAYRPSDILTSMSGKTVEMMNTDAEGRLVLADALTYIQKHHNPDVLVDIATLTGAVIIALGRTVSGVLTNEDDLYNRLYQAGEYTGERVWRLPLYEEYRSQLVSDVADIESVGGRSAGTITAAIFLKEFVDADRPWAHIDIAGTSMMEEEIARYVKNPYLPKEGGTGTGTRLLFHFVESFVES